MSFQAASGLGLSKWVEGRINGGMVTAIDPADLPDNILQLAKNVRVRFDRTFRRSGHVKLTPASPVSTADEAISKILRLATLIDNQGNSFTYLFAPQFVWRRNVSSWTKLTGSHTGTKDDRIKTVVINNEFVFANNGADPIQKIDSGANSFAALGNAPRYRFICGFYNRVVGANRLGGGSYNVEVGWCGDTNITEWDAANDITAGSTPLIESPDDFGDPISGVFGIANVLVVPREHSIWIGTKNPVGSNPFNFYNAVPRIGCNAPWSAVPYEKGLIWFDQRTGTVWLYEVGGGINSIGRPIDNALIKNIDSPERIFASYNPIENEYILCIPNVGSRVVKAWTFNFRTKAWVYDELIDISCADDVDISSGGVAIDDLIGNIDNLTGTIDSLSPTATVKPTRVYGTSFGDVIVEDPNTTLTDDNVIFDSEFVSKLFEVPEDDVIIAQVRLEYLVESDCTIWLYLQKNGGDFKLVKGPTILTDANKTKLFKYDKQIRCRQFAWKIVVRGGKFNLNKFEIHAYVTSKSKR